MNSPDFHIKSRLEHIRNALQEQGMTEKSDKQSILRKGLWANPAQAPFTAIPESTSTVQVSVLASGTLTCDRNLLVNPYKGETADPHRLVENFPCLTFLVEHGKTGKRLVFDLGVKCPISAYPPAARGGLPLFRPVVDQKLTETLSANGIDPASISTVVISHYHFDHYGNLETFPSSSELIVGVGTFEACLPSRCPFPEPVQDANILIQNRSAAKSPGIRSLADRLAARWFKTSERNELDQRQVVVHRRI